MNKRKKTSLTLVIAGLGVFITGLDQTVIVTVLPGVMLDLKVPVSQLDRAAWVVTAYLVGFVSSIPLMGRLADVYGYVRIYRGSLLIFLAGTVLVAISPDFSWMVAARVIQAVGGGAAVPISLAMAYSTVSTHRRALALGVVIGAAEAGAMLGPLYGGVTSEFLGWRWAFWMTVPLIMLVLFSVSYLPNTPARSQRVDYLGGLLVIVSLLLLTLGLSQRSIFRVDSVTPFILGGLGLAAGALLVFTQGRSKYPLLSPILIRSRAFLIANLAHFMEGTAAIITLVTIPLMATTVMGKDPFTGAMWLLRLTLAIPVGAMLGGYLTAWIGVRPVAVYGLVLAALGVLLASQWDTSIADPWLTGNLVLIGLGFGLNNTPIMAAALGPAGEGYEGTAASFTVASRLIGMALGLAALSAWGVEHFQALTLGLELPLPVPGEETSSLEARLAEYNSAVNQAGLSLYTAFFRVSGFLLLAGAVPALFMSGARRGHDEDRS